MDVKTVGVACDHAGFALKKFVLEYLDEKGYSYKDYGTWSDASVDYPDFGHALAEGIESGEVYPGIAICGSGIRKVLKECVGKAASKIRILYGGSVKPENIKAYLS